VQRCTWTVAFSVSERFGQERGKAMRITRKRAGILATVGAAVIAVATIAGCTQPQLDDLKGVNPVYPDYAVDIMNVDSFPNVTLLCYDGVAMLTTTRDYDSLTLDPGMDNICQAHMRNDLTATGSMTPPANQG
jgi:hypothetical protein